MNWAYQTFCTAFAGPQLIAAGELALVVLATKSLIDQGTQAPVLIFNDATGEQIEIAFHGTAEEVLHRLSVGSQAAAPVEPCREAPSGPGRPKLGVVAREVTLLPRHWEWLNSQPGGASVALRKLVDQARRANESTDRARQSQEAAYKFMHAMAGDFPNFEEASRALFAGNRERFDDAVASWPNDVRNYARRLAMVAFQQNAV